MEEAVDGRQASDKFQAGRYDLILMGLQMPLMDGYEANRQNTGNRSNPWMGRNF